MVGNWQGTMKITKYLKHCLKSYDRKRETLYVIVATVCNKLVEETIFTIFKPKGIKIMEHTMIMMIVFSITADDSFLCFACENFFVKIMSGAHRSTMNINLLNVMKLIVNLKASFRDTIRKSEEHNQIDYIFFHRHNNFS